MATVKCILAEQGGKGGGSSVQVGSIRIETPPTKTAYLAGETFNPAGMKIIASYTVDNIPFSESDVTGSCTFSPSPLVDGTTNVVVSYTDGNGVTVTASQPVTVTPVVVSITATTLPTKASYEYGDTLDTTGLVITATYSDGQTAAVSASCSPTALNIVGSQNITATYSENGITVTTTFQVTVNRKTITVPTWKGSLTYNGNQQSANDASLWNDLTSNVVLGGILTGTNAGDYTATVTPGANYRWPDGTTVAKDVTWNIGVLTIAVPTATNTSFTYDGNTHVPTFTYNSTYVEAGGDISGKVNAGSYSAAFTLKNKTSTKWSDNNSTTDKTIAWSITQANGSVTLSPATVSINSSNSSTGVSVSITRSGDGAITYSAAPTGITLSLSGTTLTVKGNGSTAVAETEITISVAASANYKAATAKLKVSATYWSPPSSGTTPDVTWWNGLSDGIQGMTDDELKAMVGLELNITLTSAVLGTTTHKVVCIGYNLDRDKSNTSRKTLTFQTLNCLAQTTVFGSNGKWTGSTVRTQCQNYYNALPFKSAVKTVSKGTCTGLNSSQSGTPTYQDETVFLPSDCEMGFPKGADYSNGKGYAASYDEFCQQNTSKTAYQYYNSNTRRIKKLGDSGSAQYYWERSLRYNNAYSACVVTSGGKPDSSAYNGSDGFAPAFVI